MGLWVRVHVQPSARTLPYAPKVVVSQYVSASESCCAPDPFTFARPVRIATPRQEVAVLSPPKKSSAFAVIRCAAMVFANSVGRDCVAPQYISRTTPIGRFPRLRLQGLQAPRTLLRTSARSGRIETGMTWSPVVLRPVQPGSCSQHSGSSLAACLASLRQACVERTCFAIHTSTLTVNPVAFSNACAAATASASRIGRGRLA